MNKKAIILAAGQGFLLDTFSKLLIKNPYNGLTILDTFKKFYSQENLHFVLGHRAISILNEYPFINVSINQAWATSRSASSLSLAINHFSNDDIVDIFPGDMILEDSIFTKLSNSKSSKIIIGSNRDPRSPNAINIRIENGNPRSCYKGILESNDHPEAIGILRAPVSVLKKALFNKADIIEDLYVSELFEEEDFRNFELLIEENEAFEINTPQDFLTYRSR